MLFIGRVQRESAAAHSDAAVTSPCRTTEKAACPQKGASLIYYY